MINNKKLIRAISIYEMIGGILGIITIFILISNVFPQLLSHDTISSVKIIFLIKIIFVTMVCVLSFFAGLFLWKKQKRGIVFSIWIQLIQLPKLIIAGFSYSFFLGLEFSTSFTTLGTNLTTSIGSNFNISYNPEETSFLIGFNIIALIIIVYLKEELKKGYPESNNK